jgi:hypothetical protein
MGDTLKLPDISDSTDSAANPVNALPRSFPSSARAYVACESTP